MLYWLYETLLPIDIVEIDHNLSVPAWYMRRAIWRYRLEKKNCGRLNKDNEEGCLTRSSFNYCILYANLITAMHFLNDKSTFNDALTFYCWFWYFCHESGSLPPLKKTTRSSCCLQLWLLLPCFVIEVQPSFPEYSKLSSNIGFWLID